MRLTASIAVCLLPLLLTGCPNKPAKTEAEPLAPPIVDVPPPKPEPSPTDLPPPVVTVPGQTPAPEATAQPEPPSKPPIRHKKPPANPTEQASSGNFGVSAIGQLSSGDASGLRQQTASSIAATERGLGANTRKLSDQEQKTAAQIREFLKQARAALNSGDVDGAHTLAAKAKVLLGELSR
jgi:hypothetical protein